MILHEVPLHTTTEVKAFLKKIYPRSTLCEVVLKHGDGRPRETTIAIFLEMIQSFETVHGTFAGLKTGDFVIFDSEPLQFTQVENDEFKMSIWKAKRNRYYYPEPLV